MSEHFAYQVRWGAGGWQVRTRDESGRHVVVMAGLNSQQHAEAVIAELLRQWAVEEIARISL
jgi:hypothetical protein